MDWRYKIIECHVAEIESEINALRDSCELERMVPTSGEGMWLIVLKEYEVCNCEYAGRLGTYKVIKDGRKQCGKCKGVILCS